MDVAKKEALEKKAVVVLAGVFVVIFAVGPLRRMGLFSRPAPAAGQGGAVAPTESVNVQPIGAMVQAIWQKNSSGAPAQSQEEPVTAAPPLYDAQNLRDPMQVLLPAPPVPVAPIAGNPGSTQVATEPHLDPPPVLKVQGVVWGGPDPKVIIDGRIYGVNDIVKGMRIVAIERGGMTVAHGPSTIFYTVPRLNMSGTQDTFSQQAQWR